MIRGWFSIKPRSFMFAAALPIGLLGGALSLFSFAALAPEYGEEVAYEHAYNSQTMPLLRAALNSDPNPSKGGGEVIIDHDALVADVGPSGSLADIEDRPPASDQISVYVVREGDTLSQIGVMFNISVNTIRWANDIGRGESIQPGDTLVMLPISGVRHTVESGDTLKSIAKDYSADLGEILSFNSLEVSDTLVVGEIVVVPDGEMGAPTPTRSYVSRVAVSSSSDGFYINPLPGGVRTQGIHGYNAVDLGAPRGTQILSTAAGEVIISRASGWNGGYGNYVVIRHSNGSQSLYSHMSQNIVVPGQRLVAGQVIGYVGATGRATGAHLHFEIRGARNPF